jgi:hypothetical protein
MAELEKLKKTRGTDAAFDLLSRAAIDPASDERYPDGMVLVAADSPEASKLLARAIGERKPVAVVFPDGSDLVARPPEQNGATLLVVLALLWMADLVRRRRDRPTFVPRDWVTEYHAADLGRSRSYV